MSIYYWIEYLCEHLHTKVYHTQQVISTIATFYVSVVIVISVLTAVTVFSPASHATSAASLYPSIPHPRLLPMSYVYLIGQKANTNSNRKAFRVWVERKSDPDRCL